MLMKIYFFILKNRKYIQFHKDLTYEIFYNILLNIIHFHNII